MEYKEEKVFKNIRESNKLDSKTEIHLEHLFLSLAFAMGKIEVGGGNIDNLSPDTYNFTHNVPTEIAHFISGFDIRKSVEDNLIENEDLLDRVYSLLINNNR